MNMLDELVYKDNITYQQYVAQSDTGVSRLNSPVTIKGLILKGHYTFTTGKDGENVSSNFVVRTKSKIPKHSKLNGHEVMDSIRIDSITPGAGFLNYCK